MPESDDAFDRALARPVDLDHPAVRTALDDLAARIVAAPVPAAEPGATPFWKRRRKLVVGAALAAVLAGGIGAPATAEWVREGLSPEAYEFTGENDNSATVRIDSPEFFDVVKQAAKDYPRPPGGTTERAVELMRLELSRPNSSPDIGTTGIKLSVAYDAYCQWLGYWLDAHRRGDAAQLAAAQRGLDAVPHWQVIIDRSEGHGDHEQGVADAARRGDVAEVRQWYAGYDQPLPSFTWPNPEFTELRSETRAPR